MGLRWLQLQLGSMTGLLCHDHQLLVGGDGGASCRTRQEDKDNWARTTKAALSLAITRMLVPAAVPEPALTA